VRKPRSGGRENVAVRADVEHGLRERERDDLRIGHASSGVRPSLGKEIVRGGEHPL
jgi:hypothetical protein